MQYQCPKCETTMDLVEDDHVCPECSHEISLKEANELFEEGKIIGLVEDNEINSIMERMKKEDEDEDNELDKKNNIKNKKDEDHDDDEDNDDEKKDEDAHDKDDDKKKMKKKDEDAHDKDDEEEKDEDVHDKGGDKKKMKKKDEDAHDKDDDKKKMKKEEIDPLSNIEINVEEDINALFGDEDLSEEFKTKATTVYESAVKAKVKEIGAVIVKQKNKELKEKIEEHNKKLAEELDNYLNYAVSEWVKENEVALEANMRTEMTDNFLKGLHSLFEDHYIEIPEGRYDVLEALAKELESTKGKLDEEIKKNAKSHQKLTETKKREIVSEISEGLANTEKEKLENLCEEISFDNLEEYKEKAKSLRKSYFSKRQLNDNEDDDEGNDSGIEDGSLISNVLKALKSANQ